MAHLTGPQIEKAAELVGTPFYAYSAPALRARAKTLRDGIPEAGFVYSLKANPNMSIVRCLSQAGIGAEVCSLFELEVAIAAGVCPSQIIFVGPAKAPQDIRRAVTVGLKAIIAESIEELNLIDIIASDCRVVQPVGLRINPAFHSMGAKLSMSGKPTQFGIDADDIDAALTVLADCDHLTLGGLHVYMGTRILNHEVVAENTRNILALADDIIAKLDKPLDFVDIGGGYGVPYDAGETALDFDKLAASVNAQAKTWKARHPGTKVIIELGRYMTAEAGVFVSQVRYIKTSKGVKFAICDGGTNLHGAAGTSAGFRRNFPMSAVTPRTSETRDWNISGPLCTPTDIFGNKVAMTDLQAGDLLRVESSGAYGLTASPLKFLSFATPAEVMIDGDDIVQIRAVETLDQHLAQFTPQTLTADQRTPVAEEQ